VRRAYLYALLAILCWTTGPVGSKAALSAAHGASRLTPLQVAFWAILLGWAALLLRLVTNGRWRRMGEVSGRGWVIVAAMGLTGWLGYPVAINFAYTRLPLAEAMVIGNLNPVLTILFQGAFFGWLARRISGWEQAGKPGATAPVARLALGLGLCLGGVAVIATEGRATALVEWRLSLGALAALFAATAWAVYSNLGRFVAVRPGGDPRGLADVQNFGAMTVGLAVMAALLGAAGHLAPPTGFVVALHFASLGSAATDVWVIIATMAVLNYAVGYTCWLHALELGLREGEAHRLPPLSYLLMVTAIAGGWLLLHEPVRPIFWIGAAFIAAGNAVTLWPTRRGV
jgi:drug/metabolite transporter (DMT)-like permease